jgi:hypothetical protein
VTAAGIVTALLLRIAVLYFAVFLARWAFDSYLTSHCTLAMGAWECNS